MNRDKAIEKVIKEVTVNGKNALYVTLHGIGDEIRQHIIGKFVEQETFGRITLDNIRRETLTEEGKIVVKEYTDELFYSNAYGLLAVNDVPIAGDFAKRLLEISEYEAYHTIVIDAEGHFAKESPERIMLKDTAKELMKRKPPVKLYSVL